MAHGYRNTIIETCEKRHIEVDDAVYMGTRRKRGCTDIGYLVFKSPKLIQAVKDIQTEFGCVHVWPSDKSLVMVSMVPHWMEGSIDTLQIETKYKVTWTVWGRRTTLYKDSCIAEYVSKIEK